MLLFSALPKKPIHAFVIGTLSIDGIIHLDDNLTAKLSNFRDAKDYYNQCSSKNFIKDIKVNTLIINALNDPFLSGECYPHKQVQESSCVNLETPSFGGHIGFIKKNSINSFFWSEKRLLFFLNEN